MKYSKTEQAEALQRLRDWLKPGDTIHTILRHVSASGMSREIGLVVLKDGDLIRHPNYNAACVLGLRQGKREGIIIGGCGSDMGFEIVYNLGRHLFPNGFGLVGKDKRGRKTRRPTSAVDAAKMTKRGVKFYGRNGDTSGWDNDGGYALNQKWL